MTEQHRSPGDDQLIARLRAAAGPESAHHDPYLDLPVAEEVDVEGDQACPDVGERCNAPGRRKLPVQGYFDVAVTEPVKCELRTGHPGPHRASFARTRVLHHWHALEWEDAPSASSA